MKNYRDIANDIFERREQYVVKQKRKRKVFVCTVTSMCCICVALLGFGMWQSGIFDITPSVTLDDSINIGEKDYIDPDELNDNTQKNTNNQSYEMGDNDSSNDSSISANVDIRNYPYDYSPNGSEKIMISSFDGNKIPSASYTTPKNGEFSFSIPLQNAINEYGDSVVYRVIIDVFSNKEPLSSDSSQVQDERKRLYNNGYIVAYETVFDGEYYHNYFTIHATYEELISFNANRNYGYFMYLYDERVETTEKLSIVYHGAIQ